MYLCLCRAVTLRTARRHIDAGARTVDEVGRRCGAGEACGACRFDIADMIGRATIADRCAADAAEPLAAK